MIKYAGPLKIKRKVLVEAIRQMGFDPKQVHRMIIYLNGIEVEYVERDEKNLILFKGKQVLTDVIYVPVIEG